jgi:hypothetical protein
MSTVTLRKAVTGRKKFTYTKKRALQANKCDVCGIVFSMKTFCNNDTGLAEFSGTFDVCAIDPVTDRGLGNGFRATVCSFKCADKLMGGWWRNIERYKPFADAGAILARGRLLVTAYIMDEQELIRDWATSEELKSTVV